MWNLKVGRWSWKEKVAGNEKEKVEKSSRKVGEESSRKAARKVEESEKVDDQNWKVAMWNLKVGRWSWNESSWRVASLLSLSSLYWLYSLSFEKVLGWKEE